MDNTNKYEEVAIQDLLASSPKQWQGLANEVLNNQSFLNVPGAASHHHTNKHGLLFHTYEIFASVCLLKHLYILSDEEMEDLYFAVLYHDFGKCWDYAINDQEETIKTDHYRKIFHVSRSAIEWEKLATKHNYPEERIANVTHAILSHHCLPEWGSPVQPQTKIAWLLHCCDQISAKVQSTICAT